MCQHSNPIDCQSLLPRRKLRLTRAFAVLCVTSVSLWGRSPAIGVTKPISGPSSVVFAGDSVTTNRGPAQKGPELAEHPNWLDKGVSGQQSDEVLARFQTDVIDPRGCNASNCPLAETDDPTPSRYERINIWNAWSELYALSQGVSVADYRFALVAEEDHYVPDLPIAGVDLSAAGYAVMTSIEDVMSVISSLSTN